MSDKNKEQVEQTNIKFPKGKKEYYNQAAKKMGFKTLSSFMRAGMDELIGADVLEKDVIEIRTIVDNALTMYDVSSGHQVEFTPEDVERARVLNLIEDILLQNNM